MILVTGGAGFIGAHATLALIEAGHDVTVLDSLVNGHPEAIARIGRIAGRSPRLVIGDVRDRVLVERLLRGGCEAVLHFAGLKAVGTSVADPARYYDANVAGACALIGAMRSCGVHRLIFSSSATVYGVPQILPMAETHPLDPVNPYGRSKLMVEAMLGDLAASDPDWRIVALRYFNPVGAIRMSGSSGTTTRPPTAPVSATTSMSATWRRATFGRSSGWRRASACSTSAAERAQAFSK